MYETSSMCGEVMCTANTSPPPTPPLPRLSQTWPFCTCHFSFRFQVAADSFRPSEHGGLGFFCVWGCLLHSHASSSLLWGIVSVFVPLPLTLFLGNVPLALWGPGCISPSCCLSKPTERLLISSLADAGRRRRVHAPDR